MAVRSLFLAFLAIWLLLSFWNQVVLVTAIAKHRRFVRFKWDVFALIPFWGFWSGSPDRDSVLLYRDKLADGSLTPWKSAWAMSPNPFRCIWSPQIRKWRAIDKWVPLLIDVAQGKKQPNELFLSRLYLSAAIYISGLQRSNWSEFRQFMVARASGFDREDPVEILFVSPLFRLETAL